MGNNTSHIKMNTIGYVIHRGVFEINKETFDTIVAQTKKGRKIFNNAKKHKGNDGKRKQASFNPNDTISRTFIRNIENFAIEEYPDLDPCDFVILHSSAGCAEQLAHCDYEPSDEFHNEMGDKPMGCLVAIQDNTKLNVWPRSIYPKYRKNPEILQAIQKECIILNTGDVLFFRGDLVHAGAAYDEDNYRIHCFLDNKRVPRPKNRTWFVDVTSVINGD